MDWSWLDWAAVAVLGGVAVALAVCVGTGVGVLVGSGW